MADPTTPYELARARLSSDAAQPMITWYDDATGERVELSLATLDNWVAKTANYLQDELTVGRGDRVALLLPPHWLGAVWLLACWAVGAVACAEPAAAAVVVTGPDDLDAGTGAAERVALSLRPLGGRFTAPLPAGVRDYAVEVPGQGDRFAAYDPPGPGDLGFDGLVLDGPASLADLVAAGRARARAARLDGARVLVEAAEERCAAWALDGLLVPVVTGGSAVLVRHADPAQRERRLEAERAVTASGPLRRPAGRG